MLPLVCSWIVYIICCFLIPVEGTEFQLFRRGRFQEYENYPTPMNTGSVWQDQLNRDQSLPYFSGNVWPSSDPLLPFHSGSIRRRGPFPRSSVSFYPGSSRCYTLPTTGTECEVCQRLNYDCTMVCPSRIFNLMGRRKLCERNNYIQYWHIVQIIVWWINWDNFLSIKNSVRSQNEFSGFNNKVN